ncbi:MerR family transcriptional regulator [Ruicaihuangia caeni]|uniref:MerR family transcriptional regulator n=1 Tax=Ruicaihuangia caeni TaxID=3042517 RepID=UPI00338F9B72
MDWSIQEVARMAGTTSRALRHYDDLGLLRPSRIGSNGYRYYDRASLVRLQRILLMRELGLGLSTIGEVLDQQTDEASALTAHIEWLRLEQERISRQIASIERTLVALGGDAASTHKSVDNDDEGALTMNDMFDGFDHTQYREEVEQRWGKDAYKRSADWWESKTEAERSNWQQRAQSLGAAWLALAEAKADPHGAEAQDAAARHVDWLRGIPGTPAERGDAATVRAYVEGLAEMYVADERFAANYGGAEGAAFVRAALLHYVATAL